MMPHRANRLWRAIAAATVTMAVLPAVAVPATAGVTLARAEQEITFALTPEAIEITYVTTFNRPAAFIEQMRMDADGDGIVSRDEMTRYFADLASNLSAGLDLSIDGTPVALAPTGPPETAVLNDKRSFEKVYRFVVPHRPGWRDGAVVEFHNDNYLDFGGRVTVEIDPGDAADVDYDSRWARTDEVVNPADASERDVTFRYRGGRGRYERPADFTPGLAPAGGDSPPGDSPVRGFITSIGALVAFGLAAVFCVPWTITRKLSGRPWRRVIIECWVFLAIATCCAAFTVSGASDTAPPDWAAAQIFQGLHRTIYRAFDAKTESEIYDTLAAGLTGEILDEVYNDVYQAFASQARGGGRFSVRRVKPVATTVLPADDVAPAAFRVRYRWRVYGRVTHAGHTHARTNEYEAVYLVRHAGGAWRIAASRVRRNARVTAGQS